MPTSISDAALVRFGMFEVDLRSGNLRKNGVKIKLQELPFRALRLLLTRPNEIVTREELRAALWPEGVYVDFDHGISSAINRLRDALGESANQAVYIETVERRGYRWIAPTAVSSRASGLQPSVAPEEAQPPVQTRRLTRWNFSLPLLAALLALVAAALWIVHSTHRSANANASAHSTTSANSPGGSAPTRPAANREAEDLYLKGRYYWNRRTADDLNKAVDYFTQAVVHDPAYAPAYVGLADSYNLLREYSLMPTAEAYPRALAAARKAVELDEQSSAAHTSLAFVSFWGEWDATTADREFRRAVELDPNNALAHHWNATYLAAVGRNAEALAEIAHAQAAEPTSTSILADKGLILIDAGRHDDGIALLKQLETTESAFVSPHRYLKQFYFAIRDYPDYLTEFKKEAALMRDDTGLAVASAAEKGFTSGGEKGLLESLRVSQKNLVDQRLASPFPLAQTCARLGDVPAAIHYLQAAYDFHDEFMLGLEVDPVFAEMRANAAFQELVARIRSHSAK